MSRYQYIFVHGLSGWGSYDPLDRRLPYWGMRGGSLMTHLRANGYDCHAASVSPGGSAWDRACELYAQLAGVRVDYGEAHSRKYRHDRFGRDFSSCPLIPEWTGQTRLVLLGHSFGGTTVRLLSALLAHGDPQERRLTASPSPLFLGGMAERIHGIVALASPMNGTTAYDMFRDPAFDPRRTRVPVRGRLLARLMSRKVKAAPDGRDERDFAGPDMHLDRAAELNRRIPTLSGVWYFSVPASCTLKQPDGSWRPKREMEPLFVARSCQIGAYRGRTAGGIVVDERWLENDGLVNTVSAMAPSSAPSTPLNRASLRPGEWNVFLFPTLQGDHMWPQGGLKRRHDIRGFYLDLLRMIDSLPPGSAAESAPAD